MSQNKEPARASRLHHWHCFIVVDCWHITALLLVTQWRLSIRRECRYKFLRRWAQYGIHSGARGWEINQYQTSWVRASALRGGGFLELTSFSLLSWFFLHLLIGQGSRAPVRFAVSSVIASTVFVLRPLLWFIGEIMRGNGGCAFVCCAIRLRLKGHHTLLSVKVLMLWGALWRYDSSSLVESLSVTTALCYWLIQLHTAAATTYTFL